jgi:heme/copper-type cytochrome/quinol oxidase subunit 4
MKISNESSPSLVWFVLCGLTIFSLVIFESASWRLSTSVLVVLISAIKARLIIVHFMHVRQAQPHWRFLYEAWNVVVTATIVIGCLLSQQA